MVDGIFLDLIVPLLLRPNNLILTHESKMWFLLPWGEGPPFRIWVI
jgi:hypothetical protein